MNRTLIVLGLVVLVSASAGAGLVIGLRKIASLRSQSTPSSMVP